MATVVVDSSDVTYSPVHSPAKHVNNNNNINNNNNNDVRRRKGLRDDYGKYELLVLAVTQLSYLPITATMLATSFYKPSTNYCLSKMTNETTAKALEPQFISLLNEWNTECNDSYILPTLSTSLMSGALTGAFVAGWLADAYGRQPVVKGCLLLVSLISLLFTMFAHTSWIIAAGFFFWLGVASGGYMVTNLVFLIECFENPRSRLLAVSLNGWSISMVAVAILARHTLHWFYYHLYIAAFSFIAALVCHFLTYESARWLAGIHRLHEAKAVAIKISNFNNRPTLMSTDSSWAEILGFQVVTAAPEALSEVKKYGYADLFSFPSVYWPLVSLCYCFVASSIVSFGFYFIVDVLPGDRYMNMATMGTSKFMLGLVPFLVSHWMGRRPIVLFSVATACACLWSLCISQLLGIPRDNVSMTILSLVVAASLDPTWKINHLYSAELFPTVVRNMARGMCNVGARLGSVAAPSIVHLQSEHYLLPFLVFAVLLTLQLFVVAKALPETKDRPLPEELPEEMDDKSEVICLETC